MQPTATTSQDALQQLQGAQASAQDPNSILKAQQQGLGVNAAQDTVTGLRGAINNTTKLLGQVAPSVMGRTGNSLVTSAQANRIIQNEQAPLNQSLSDQSTKYNQSQQDLNNLQQEAQQAASGIYTGQQNKMSYLQNLYNSLYGKEQDAAKMAEQQREFNAQQATARGANSGLSGILGDLFGGSGSTPASNGQPAANGQQAVMSQRNGGGFNFTAGGNQINAAQFAHLTGQNFRDVLSQMAAKGDTGAKQALSFVGNDYGYDPTRITSPTQIALYNALTGANIKYNPQSNAATNTTRSR